MVLSPVANRLQMDIDEFDLVGRVSRAIDQQLEVELEQAEERARLLAGSMPSIATKRPPPINDAMSSADRELVESIWARAKVVGSKKEQTDILDRKVWSCKTELAGLEPPSGILVRIVLSLLSIMVATLILVIAGSTTLLLLYLRPGSITDSPAIGFMLMVGAVCASLLGLLLAVRSRRKGDKAKRLAYSAAKQQLLAAQAEFVACKAEHDAEAAPLQVEVLELIRREITQQMQARREEILDKPEN